MLNKEEELRVASFISLATEGVKNPDFDTDLPPKAILWLAEKCKELNHEAAKYSEELYKANKELADFREHYEG